MAEYIHGQTTPYEAARLEKQARFIAPSFYARLPPRPGERALDLATGVGAMAQQLVDRYAGISLTGLDLKMAQLDLARRNHPIATYVQGDGLQLPFRDETFDKVYCSWLLEHVQKPLDLLGEVRRVLRPGGACLFIEVDNSSLRIHPECAEVLEVMAALNEAQLAGGGDPFIGRRLGDLMRGAGFTHVSVEPNPFLGDSSTPELLREISEDLAEIFESVAETLGPDVIGKIHAAIEWLRQMPQIRGAEIYYHSFVACAVR